MPHGSYSPFSTQNLPMHQTRFIKGRTTHAAALHFAHLIRTHKDHTPVLLDFEKAFDSVAHEWLKDQLMHFDLPLHITNIIFLCMTAPQHK